MHQTIPSPLPTKPFQVHYMASVYPEFISIPFSQIFSPSMNLSFSLFKSTIIACYSLNNFPTPLHGETMVLVYIQNRYHTILSNLLTFQSNITAYYSLNNFPIFQEAFQNFPLKQVLHKLKSPLHLLTFPESIF